MTRSRVIAALLALTVATVACGRDESQRGFLQGPPPVRVGLLLDSLQEERWQRDRDLFVERVRELDGEVLVREANRDPDLQEQQARELLDEDIKALVIVPTHTERAAAIVKMANDRQVPVISYDRLILNADVTLYMSFDNVKVGRMQAEYLLNQAPKGNYVLIGGSQADHNAKLLRQGQLEMLKPAIAAGSVRIVADPWAEDWSTDAARQHTAEALKKNKNQIAAVVASNDNTAGGAIEALRAVNLAGKVPVSGQDADLEAIRRIVAGTQAMTVYKPIRPLARMAAGAAVNMGKGQTEDGLVTINNGFKEVPARLLEPISVDRAAVDRTVIADGFHRREDVYQGTPAQ
jgi:D-xylose transport system substrate-binding protein